MSAYLKENKQIFDSVIYRALTCHTTQEDLIRRPWQVLENAGMTLPSDLTFRLQRREINIRLAYPGAVFEVVMPVADPLVGRVRAAAVA